MPRLQVPKNHFSLSDEIPQVLFNSRGRGLAYAEAGGGRGRGAGGGEGGREGGRQRRREGNREGGR